MIKGLLSWLEAPRADVGVRIAEQDEWTFYPYPVLAGLTRAAASAMVDAGVMPDDRVCILLPSSVHFITAFFGAHIAGATPSPLPPPYVIQGQDQYVAHLAAMLRVARPQVVCTNAMLRSFAEKALKQAEVPAQVLDMASAGGDPNFPGRRPPALGLLQFTSGSTGTPRGVALGLDHVEANVRAIEAWLDMDPDSKTATWLPFSHDMGLIGTLLTPVATQTALSVIPPEQFVVKPARWLECFGRGEADITASPTFGLGLAARRVRPEDLDGLDFSGWRVLIVGAERVRAEALEAFTQLLAPRGFSRSAFRPAYGLAEATLAATGHGGGEVASMVKVDWEALRDTERVCIDERRAIGPVDPSEASDWLIGCGRPLTGVDLEVIEPGGAAVLPEGHLGEIVVGGSSLAAAYWTADRRDESPFASRRFATGDVGFLLDGELYVVGRIGDRLKVRARYVYAEDVEARLVAGTVLRIGRLAVLLGALEGVDTAVVIVEEKRGDWDEEVLRIVRQATGEELRIHILEASRGTIERTTSGKPRRRVMWTKLKDGLLSTALVRDWSPR